MHTNYYLRECIDNGVPMPSAMHLLYFNCTEPDDILVYSWFWEVNIKVFAPYLKAFKKARRGHYCGLKLNTGSVNFIIGLIENHIDQKRGKVNQDG